MTTSAVEPTKAIPPRRAAFVREYLVDLNASRAARDVGYAAKSASVEGSRLLANAEVQAEITRQRAILMEQSNVTPEKIVVELAVIAFSDLGDYIRIHQDGTPSIELGNMSPGATRAIASLNTDVTKTATGRQTAKLRIKLHDKQVALISLAKMFGLPRLTWHHLRYNCGSYLLSENVPITPVSKILGHANPAITMSIYAHELPEDLDQVRVAMGKFG